jgi:uncharacterized damage-inducible protein DinB
MRHRFWLAMIGLAAPLALHAQATTNPVVASAREIFTRQSALIAKAAEQMPEDKYSYHPTPDQRTFAQIIAHVVQSDFGVCGILAGSPAPQIPKVSDTDSKDTLVAAVKASFSFCDETLANLPDSKLGDTITFIRGAQTSRARALFEITDDLEDHYSQLASYLRMVGLTPPSATPMKNTNMK